jgi:hypothetical protein
MSGFVQFALARMFRQRTVLTAFAVISFLLASFTPNHYWDEYFYLYSVRHHSPLALLTMESGLSGLFPYGFFTAKLGFITFLWALVGVAGDSPFALAVVRLVFAGLTLGLAAASYQVVRCLNGNSQEAFCTALVLLFLPVSLYLGFKTLSEFPSLLLATIACWQFLTSFRTQSSRSVAGRLFIAAMALALAGLFRFTTGVFFGGLVLALLAVPDVRFPRRLVVARAAAVIGMHFIIAGLLYTAFVGSPVDRFEALVESVTERQPGVALKIYAVTITLQLFAIPLAVALLRRWTPLVKLACVWLTVCIAPVFVSSYMEPRYFYMALLPLAMLVFAGLRILSGHVRFCGTQGWLALGIVLVVANYIGFAPLMPYSINENDYARLIGTTEKQRRGGTYLTAYVADYCFLTLTFPERMFVLTMNRTRKGRVRVFETPEFQRWVRAGRYSGSLKELSSHPQPWIYVGWTYNPSVLALKARLRWLGIRYIERIETNEKLRNHLAQSWIWDNNDLRLQQIAAVENYQSYQVVPKSQVSGAAARLPMSFLAVPRHTFPS